MAKKNRNRSAKQRREAKERKELQIGQSYLVLVQHPLLVGNEIQSIEFQATLVVQADGRTVLENVRRHVKARLERARQYFASFQINRDWWEISAIPVQLSRRTQMGKSQTARIMDRAMSN